MGFHIAQVNIAVPREPLDAPLLDEFVGALAPVNAAADAAPGFVWRLQTEDGDSTAIRAFGDERLILNMSVWESVQALRTFAYSNRKHIDVMRRRREWFEQLGEAHVALWWIPVGHEPTVYEAEQRLALLRTIGPSPDAFTFRQHFSAPGDAANSVISDDRELCPAG